MAIDEFTLQCRESSPLTGFSMEWNEWMLMDKGVDLHFRTQTYSGRESSRGLYSCVSKKICSYFHLTCRDFDFWRTSNQQNAFQQKQPETSYVCSNGRIVKTLLSSGKSSVWISVEDANADVDDTKREFVAMYGCLKKQDCVGKIHQTSVCFSLLPEKSSLSSDGRARFDVRTNDGCILGKESSKWDSAECRS